MHGRELIQALGCGALLVLAAGCGNAPPPPAGAAEPPPPAAAGRFDPATAGTIEGRVTWAGELPDVPPFTVWGEPTPGGIRGPRRAQPNPNAPAIDPHTRGVGNAVVFLRGVDPARARPWDHPPVRVEQRDYRLHVLQGDADARDGFVRRGAPVEMLSRQPAFHSLRADGSAFFTLAFPDPDQPLSRRLDRGGVVELSSAAGYFWMRAYLFVSDHPYFTRTDAAGRFTLPQVPPGDYRVVCWMPSWVEARHERDLEFGLVNRVAFREPAEWVRPVTLGPADTRAATFTASADDFRR
jgi:hypothetical protein